MVFLPLWGRQLRPSPVNNILLLFQIAHIFQMSDSLLVPLFSSECSHRVKVAQLLEKKKKKRRITEAQCGKLRVARHPPTHAHTPTHTEEKSVVPVWIKYKVAASN